VAAHEASIHATIVGVALGMLTAAHPPPRPELERATALTASILAAREERLASLTLSRIRQHAVSCRLHADDSST
jgi:hypothetical protein